MQIILKFNTQLASYMLSETAFVINIQNTVQVKISK